MSSQHTGTLLLTALFMVAIVRSVSALPTGGSRLLDRRPRFVHYASSDADPYSPCASRGFRKDLQLTARTIHRTNDTLTMMKQDVYMSGVLNPSVVFEDDSGLAPLYRNLSRFEITIPTVILEGQDLDSYSATLRQSMHDTGSDLNKLLFKLSLTLTAAGEFGDQGWTVDPILLPDVRDSLYRHYRRDFIFFQQLYETLEQLKEQLQARLAEC